MPFVSGFLRLRGRPGHPDNELPGGMPGHPDQGLPGYGHPDQGLPGEQPGIDNELPTPPPGVWPPPTVSHPIEPAPPGTPPGVIWPPAYPPRPDNTLPPMGGSGGGRPARPDQGLPPAPGAPDNTLPAQPGTPTHPIANQTYWMVCYSPRLGWKYVTVDPTLSPTPPMAPTPEPK